MGEESAVAPRVTVGQFARRHLFGAEHDVGRVIEPPVLVQQPPLGFELSEQRRSGIRRKDVECGALQAVVLGPIDRSPEHVRAVSVEAKHKAGIHLDAVIVQ